MKTHARACWLALCLMAVPVYAQEEDWLAVAPKAGTLGLGGDLIVRLSPEFNTRLGINALGTDLDLSFSGIDYKVGLDFLSASAILDWHLFDNGFRVSAGVLYNQNEADFDAKWRNSYNIGNATYQSDDVGNLTGDFSYDQKFAPYVGIGWGNAFDSDKRYGLMCDFGVVYTGNPDIALRSTGPLASDATFQADLAREADKIEHDLNALKFYPVIAVSLFYRF